MKGTLHKKGKSWTVRYVKTPERTTKIATLPVHPYQKRTSFVEGQEVEFDIEVLCEYGIDPIDVAAIKLPKEYNAAEWVEEMSLRQDLGELDDFHYHEVLDRLTMIGDMVERYLIDHPVLEEHKALRDVVEKAQDLIGDAYLMMGDILQKRENESR